LVAAPLSTGAFLFDAILLDEWFARISVNTYFQTMTCGFFKTLSYSVQASIIEEKGVYLTSRINAVSSILLYQVDAFYVEAYLSHKDEHLIGFKCFDTTYGLEPYLKKIDLSQLMADIN
jgi:hypothetical protein